MTRAWRAALGGLLVVGAAALVRVVSFVPYTAERDEGAVVRLAWRARGERVRACRRRTPEELARLPAHMRQEEVCEGRVLPYRLVVRLDSVEAVNREVRGAGARQDRPLYVFEDLPVAPGRHRVAVSFTLEGPRPEEARGGAEGAGAVDERQPLRTPVHLELDTTLALGARRIVLVTYDDERELLTLRDGSSR